MLIPMAAHRIFTFCGRGFGRVCPFDFGWPAFTLRLLVRQAMYVSFRSTRDQLLIADSGIVRRSARAPATKPDARTGSDPSRSNTGVASYVTLPVGTGAARSRRPAPERQDRSLPEADPTPVAVYTHSRRRERLYRARMKSCLPRSSAYWPTAASRLGRQPAARCPSCTPLDPALSGGSTGSRASHFAPWPAED